MASIGSTVVVGFSYGISSPESLNRRTGDRVGTQLTRFSYASGPRRRLVVVRAEGNTINPEVRKTEDKVVDSVIVSELSKPLTAYCRCWRSGTFPLCDGSHVKHNKATGDNVGPLLVKKQ
ncbi:unnamed protein product [Ilex paraguariensis]|uniref:Iron-binding zinc finger CDGSH type domain-containing protein n=1 Tax=Ilex paraguariensis TaxID=185542 RepID=A0ABC8QR57_9AQUA